jgi:hypothetical protein
MSALTGAAFRIDSADAQQSTDPQALVALADHFYWLNNGTAAGPLYARAEKLFSERLYLAYNRNHGMRNRVAR